MLSEHARAFHVRRLAIAIASMFAFAGTCLAADPVASFYNSKRLEMIIGYSPGGTYDLYARLVARHLGKHIPGHPQFVPRNMPGAGSRTAASWAYAVAPKDGTVLVAVDQSLPIMQALGDSKVKMDMRQFHYIGNPNSDNNTMVVWAASGVKTLDDAKTREVTMGATGSATSAQTPRLVNAVYGTRFKVVAGYPGGNEINIAMERGEVDGRGSNSWTSWKSTRAHWLKEKKINVLVQVGLEKASDLPDVPLLIDIAKSDEDRAMLRLFSASSTLGRPVFTTPGTPPERVAALRAAFDTMVKDPAFLAEAKTSNLDIDPVGGNKLQDLVSDILATPKHVSERALKIVEGN